MSLSLDFERKIFVKALYSKARLVKLLNLASFKKLFTHFIDSGSLEEMLQTDRTLSININGYRKRVSKLTAIMLNGVDK
jgi:hypothetical protein